MTYAIRTAKGLDLGDGLELTKSSSMITITRESNKADEEYAIAYEKRYNAKYTSNARPIAITAYYHKIPGCCSGTMLSRLSFPLSKNKDIMKPGKQISIVNRAKLLKLLMKQFDREAILLYVGRSDSKVLPKTFAKAGWKKSTGPVGRYNRNYTLDTYTVDPRTPKRKLLPPLKSKKKKVVTKAQAPKVIYTGWRKYFGFSTSNVKRRIGELRR